MLFKLIESVTQMISTKKIKLSTNPSVIEKICYKNGIYFLQHDTDLAQLLNILKDGCLKPRSFMTATVEIAKDKEYTIKRSNKNVVYLAPYLNRLGKKRLTDYCFISPTDDSVRLLLSLKLLERTDYYVNRFWRGGWSNEDSYTYKDIQDLQKTGNLMLSCKEGEFCFDKSIDLSLYLDTVIVSPQKKDSIVMLLQKENVNDDFIKKIEAHEVSPSIRDSSLISQFLMSFWNSNKSANLEDKLQNSKSNASSEPKR